MEIEFKKMNDEAQEPKYAHVGDSGFDFVALEDVTVSSGETIIIDTGLSFNVPMGYELQVRPRSGMSFKTKIRVANSPGTVDSNFRGSVGIIIENTGDCFYNIKKGDRIAQGIICPIITASFKEVSDLSSSDRGQNGFGSTDSIDYSVDYQQPSIVKL